MMNAISTAPAANTAPAEPQNAENAAEATEGSEFLEMVLNEISEMPGGDAAGAIAQQIQQMQEDSQKEGTNLAMQMLSELLGTNPEIEELFKMLTEENPELVQQLQQMAVEGTFTNNQSQTLQQLLTGEPQQKAAVAQNFLSPGAAQEKAATSPYGAKAQPAKADAEGMDNISVEVISPGESAGKQEAGSSEDLLGGQSKFRDSILEAKKLLKTNGTQDNALGNNFIDIEKLQSQVDNTRLNATKVAPKEIPLSNPKDVMNQVQTGISENVASGKNEFVVKLKPEGLGEIIVKLVETDNKMTLSIMTSNTQVAKLLSNELGVLKDSLRPYNVEVREVVSQTASSNSTLGAESNQQFSQNFAGQHGQNFARNMPQYYYSGDGELDMSAFPPDMLQHIQVTGLDTYI